MPVHRTEAIGYYETLNGCRIANMYTYISTGHPEMQGYSAEWIHQQVAVVAPDPFSLQELVEKVAECQVRSVLFGAAPRDQQDRPPWA